MVNIKLLIQKFQNNKIITDSVWAILGTGLGNFLIMVSGILIARFLGKDLYGEYGVVKTTMFYIASFATFGIGLTSTKYISQFVAERTDCVKNIVRDCLKITLAFSCLLAVAITIFSNDLAKYLGEPSLSFAFKMLGCIIVFRALTTTLLGVLAGLKSFKKSAINNLLSSLFMIATCVPLSYVYSLKGALLTLLLSQFFNFVINLRTLKKEITQYHITEGVSFTKELVKFSFPVALQESSIWVCNWICIMMLTKMSSTGELGLYTAAAQWNAVIAMLPALLSNVVLTYVAETVNDSTRHNYIVKWMFIIHFGSTLVPFIIIYILSNVIASFYGNTFSNLPSVLQILTFNAVLESCAGVFKAEFLSANKAWTFFSLRFARDLFMTCLAYSLLSYFGGINGAVYFSLSIVVTSAVYLLVVFLVYRIYIYNKLYK